jgi:hypothetical protein
MRSLHLWNADSARLLTGSVSQRTSIPKLPSDHVAPDGAGCSTAFAPVNKAGCMDGRVELDKRDLAE